MPKLKESSTIKSVSYNPDTQVMEVTFTTNGTVFEYHKVGSKEYESFKEATSKGSYFHKNIKNKYKASKK